MREITGIGLSRYGENMEQNEAIEIAKELLYTLVMNYDDMVNVWNNLLADMDISDDTMMDAYHTLFPNGPEA